MGGYKCVVCETTVRPRKKALQCDDCSRWQHRACGSGISKKFYRQLVKGEEELPHWQCTSCASCPSPQEAQTAECVQLEAAAPESAHVDSEPQQAATVTDTEQQEESQVQGEVTYKVIASSTTRGRDKLFDSVGFSYVFKIKRKNGSTVWRCSKRSTYCPAVVTQQGDNFTRTLKQHNHEYDVGCATAAVISRNIKEKARQPENNSRPASRIVEDVLKKDLTDAPCSALPSLDRMQHNANRARAKQRQTRQAQR